MFKSVLVVAKSIDHADMLIDMVQYTFASAIWLSIAETDANVQHPHFPWFLITWTFLRFYFSNQ